MKKKMPKIQVVDCGGAPVTSAKVVNRQQALKNYNTKGKAGAKGNAREVGDCY